MELGLGLTSIIPIILYFTGIVVFGLTLFYKTEIGLYFLIPLLTQQSLIERLGRYPFGEDFVDILYLLLIIKWFASRQEIVKVSDIRKPVTLVVGVIALWSVFTIVNRALVLDVSVKYLVSFSNPTLIYWKNFIMLPLLYAIVVNTVKNKRQIKIILLLMTLSMLYMDRSFYHNFGDKNTANYREDLRVEATFSYLGPNETAVFYAQNSILLLCLFYFDTNRRRRTLVGITTFFNYYCLMFLYSRGGYLAGLVGWGFLGFVKDRRVLLILAVCFIFWKMIVPVSVVQRIEMSLGDSSIDARYEMWNQALELISERPLLGYGIKSTPRLGITTAGHKEERVSLHNGYLELTLEQGGIGLGIFLIFFFICFRCGWRLYRSATEGFFKGLGLGFAGCVLAVLAGNVAGSYWFYLNVSGFYWTTFALVVRSLEIMNEPKLEENRELLQPTATRKSAGFFKHHIDALLE